MASHEQAHALPACLDALGGQVGGLDAIVTVVDCVSEDGSADLALHHPVVDRVLLATHRHPLAPYEQGMNAALRPVIAFADAGWVPPANWLASALATLVEGADVTYLREGDTPADISASGMVIARAVIERIGLFHGATPTEFCARAVAAGFDVRAVAPGTSSTPPNGQADRAASRTSSETSRPDESSLFSVVLCTTGDRESLRTCIDSLAKLDDPNFEVVLVENAPAPTLRDHALPSNVRHIHEPRQGLDIARNRGMHEAAGDLVAFIDDDCEADASWLTALRGAFADPEVSMVSGRVVPASLALPTERWFEAWFPFDRGPDPDRFTRYDHREWFPYWPGAIGTGCNMAFRRDTFLTFATFDPALDMGTPIGGGGDLDMFVQYLDADNLIAYTPDAIVEHRHRATDSELRRQFFGYGATVGALTFKYAGGRKGWRRASVRFFIHHARYVRGKLGARRHGDDEMPAALLAAELAGQFAGPLLYLRSRQRASR